MRFLIISDTHGRIDRASDLIQRFHGSIDGVWHLGDNYRDFELLQSRFAYPYRLAFQAVPGNCDQSCPAPQRRTIPIAGHKVFMTHGDMYGVFGTGIGTLPMAAKSAGADVVLFGHTHVPLLEEKEGVLYLNPGSLSLPRGGSRPAYAFLDIEQGKAPQGTLVNY